MRKVTLKEMLENIVNCILNKTEIPRYFYKNGYDEYDEILEVDLLRGRFVTAENDFSEYEWELEKSHIYVEE